MTSFLRILRLLSLVAWVGSLFFFAFAVTRVAFSGVLPDAHSAAAIVRGTLVVLHHIGFASGFVFLIATLTLIGTQRDSHLARAIETLTVLVMLSLTAYSHFSVIPRMESDRLALGGDVATAPADSPAHRHFDRLHNLSVKLEGTVLLCGILLVCLAPFPQRSPQDRMYL